MNFSAGIGNAFEPFNAISLDGDNRFKADVGDYQARIHIDCILSRRENVEEVLHQFSEAMYQLLETVKKSEIEKTCKNCINKTGNNPDYGCHVHQKPVKETDTCNEWFGW